MEKTITYKSSSGKDRVWTIRVETAPDPSKAYIDITHGEVKGKLQTARRIVTGKNIGRANETSAFSQAIKEAEAKYKLKLESVQGTNAPMLAQTYAGTHVHFPCYIQPKINGVRGVYDPNTRKIYSRLGNEFPHLDHILSDLQNIHIALDGELYSSKLSFEELVGLVKKKKFDERIHLVEFHVFDCILPNEPFKNRLKILYSLPLEGSVIPLETMECEREDYIDSYLEQEVDAGYEGIIIRNKNGLYHNNKRSHDLQKYKKFVDQEFKIINYERENNGQTIVWICETAQGRTFAVKPSGTVELRSLSDSEARRQIGKWITVKYQELTSKKVPRFPVGLGIRDYE